ncbi:Telomerase ribonucleoprotein complex - RNA-binding domain [Dillenia turbinata]|uniref:Telomerase reverse transcriptase n=1 Tax=Dillenia turbinata TaxID=194707 RepID=A0AAN8VQ85_9MAGN
MKRPSRSLTMEKKRRRRVPEVIWRLYGDRARSLAETIISLIPPSSKGKCCCRGSQKCLACSDDAMSYLLRRDDPSSYSKLLRQCFVVVSQNAPPFPSSYHRRSHWSQLQVVTRTIEMMISEEPKTPNVLCSGYDKISNSSFIVELLTTSEWRLLLKRVGDGLMVYLLHHTAIFLPLPRKNHHQVAGSPVSELGLKFSKKTSLTKYSHSSVLPLGPSKRKRKLSEEFCVVPDNPQFHSSGGSLSCLGCKNGNHFKLFKGHCKRSHKDQGCSEVTVPTSVSNNANNLGDPDADLECSGKVVTNHKKRSRPFRWQRQRKRMKSCSEEANILNSLEELSNADLSEKPQSNASFNGHLGKVPLKCFCCVILQHLQKDNNSNQIDRWTMFYKTELSPWAFPRNHILYTLKPNFAGALSLMRDIFGFCDMNISTQHKTCFHSIHSCRTRSACLYHSLVKLSKVLICKAQSCQHLRLLDKHCPDQSVLKGGKMISKNRNAGAQLECNLPRESSDGFDQKHNQRAVEDTDNQFEKSYCSFDQVVSFIWAICRSIVPPDLLGTPSNWRVLRKNIAKFIRLRRFEKFSPKQCMQKLKMSGLPFIANKHSMCYSSKQVGKKFSQLVERGHRCEQNDHEFALKHKIMEGWIVWLFSRLVIPLVRTNFYVTETEYGKHNVFYYRKSTWKLLTKSTISMLKDQSYKLLDEKTVKDIISDRSFGFSRVRLCPKQNGLRALANLRASSKFPIEDWALQKHWGAQRKARAKPRRSKYKHFKSVNSILCNLHAVLKGIQKDEPLKLGSSVFDLNGIYRKLCPFLTGLKKGSTATPVFIVISDVSNAFDSVDQDKLLSVMQDLISQDEYHLNQSWQIKCMKKSFWVHKNKRLLEPGPTTCFLKSLDPVVSRSSQSILVQDKGELMRKEEIYSSLHEHVRYNILQLDKKFYLQEVGIPQGSILSSLLCSFYYGHMERNILYPYLEKVSGPSIGVVSEYNNGCHVSAPQNNNQDDTVSFSHGYILLRFIDDFLFMSTSKKAATSFFDRIRRGFRDYNCYMNEKKFGMNFDRISDFSPKRVRVGEDGISFLRWSGLLINCCTLEIQADYTRYPNNHLSSTLTVCWQGELGHHLKTKLCGYLRPKCHPIFFDSNINSAAVVRLNIYQAFLLCAMKFHCYVRDWSTTCKPRTLSFADVIEASIRLSFVIVNVVVVVVVFAVVIIIIIDSSIWFFYKLIKRRIYSICPSCSFKPILLLKRAEVEWLGLKAFLKVLQKKHTRYKALLDLLSRKLHSHVMSWMTSSELNYAVDDSHSSSIWKIKY